MQLFVVIRYTCDFKVVFCSGRTHSLGPAEFLKSIDLTPSLSAKGQRKHRMPRTDRPQDVANRLAQASARRKLTRDSFRRETFALPREAARAKAREMFSRYPKAAYMTEIESWRELPGDEIEFTMRRLPTAD